MATPDEIREAVRRFQAELDATAPAIGRVLEEFDECQLCGLGNPADTILEERQFSAVDPRGELVYSIRCCAPCAALAKAMHAHAETEAGR